ncbi:MAG: hypothetical protein Q8Q25_00845, partial [bacterium]|nr:hypothetical protein [bacterium]
WVRFPAPRPEIFHMIRFRSFSRILKSLLYAFIPAVALVVGQILVSIYDSFLSSGNFSYSSGEGVLFFVVLITTVSFCALGNLLMFRKESQVGLKTHFLQSLFLYIGIVLVIGFGMLIYFTSTIDSPGSGVVFLYFIVLSAFIGIIVNAVFLAVRKKQLKKSKNV